MQRVHILDYQMLRSLGLSREEHLQSLRSSSSGAGTIKNFATEGLPNKAGAEVKADLSQLLSSERAEVQEAARYDRKLELLLACKGLVQAPWRNLLEGLAPSRIMVSMGLGLDICPVEAMSAERPTCDYVDWSGYFNSKSSRPNILGNPIDTSLQSWREFLSPEIHSTSNVLTACASSAQALGLCFRALRRGEKDVAIVGGGDSLLNLLGYVSFLKMGVIPHSNEEPHLQCKPLDVSRNGTLLGEGAALFLLANESALQRLGVNPSLEFLGYGSSLDAFKITAPDPEGQGMKLAMRRALKEARLAPGEIEYLNLHGTGTKANDPAEVEAVAEVFEGRALPVSSSKDRHGHLIAGAGALELGLTCLALENQFMIGNLNLQRPIESKGLEFLLGSYQNRSYATAMSNSFAFGGVNASLIVRRRHP